MKAEMTATIVGGVLKPDQQLSLPDQTRVRLTLETISIQPDGALAWSSLKARLRQRPIRSGRKRFTREELHERR